MPKMNVCQMKIHQKKMQSLPLNYQMKIHQKKMQSLPLNHQMRILQKKMVLLL